MTQTQIKVAIGLILAVALGLGIAGFLLGKPQKAKPQLEVTSTAAATATFTLAPTPTEGITPSPTATATAEATATIPTPTPAAYTYPESFYITDITGHRQVYSLGCEASVSVDWANYFDVPIIEYTFQVSLPLSDNPDYGFVGDVNSPWGQIPPYGYGVHAGPVADLLISYGLPAKSVKGYTLDALKQKISEAKPIIAWVIGNMEWSEPVNYTDSEGRVSVVAPYEHVVIVTGYNADSIRYMTNGRFFDTPTDVFMTSWGVLGNMAVIYGE